MKNTILLWLPRVAGVVMALFLSLFALGAFHEGKGLGATADFLRHLLPALTVLFVVLVAWRRPLFGAIAFIGLALAYAVTTTRLDWILTIAGPLAGAGLLYGAAWFRFRGLPAPDSMSRRT